MALAFLLAAILQTSAGPPPGQVQIVPRNSDCRPAADPEEIVVCGEGPEDNPYRVPREFRNLPTNEDRDASHSTRTWDLEAIERFDDQVSGPGAYLRYGRELDCQYRVAIQQRQGRRPDCRAKLRPDDPADWQRR